MVVQFGKIPLGVSPEHGRRVRDYSDSQICHFERSEKSFLLPCSVATEMDYRSRPFLFVPLCAISCGQQDEIGDFLRFRNKRDVTRVDFDRFGFHSIGKETLQLRRGRLVLF